MEFNPIKETFDGKKAHDMIWSSTVLDKAISGIIAGKKLIANPFYENNIKLLKGDLVYRRTPDEIDEWNRCRNDILYFANKYCKLMTPQGIRNVTMRPYQKNYLKHLVDNRLSIFLSCRQSGKTTTSAIFLLHYILFNFDKNSLVLGNKRRTATEILDKIKKIFLELPYFLKPGIYKWNESEIVLDNGCRCMAEATTINSGISFTFHCVLADEFAHIAPNILEKFYNNLFPTITAGKARFIISSTQNGYNLFYRLYKGAEAKENEYGAFKVDWWEVPEWNPEKQCWEKRDEKWHKMQIANYGSEEAFNQQFGTNFDVSSNTLISTKYLKSAQSRAIDFVNIPLDGVHLSEYFKWNPMFSPHEELRKHHYVITVDISEGGGGDYTVFVINRMKKNEMNEIDYEAVGYFRCNCKDIKNCVVALRTLCMHYMDVNKYCVSVELNMYGDLFVNLLKEEVEKNPLETMMFNEDVLCKYYNESGTKFSNGIKITHSNKAKACMLFKNDYEHGHITNCDTTFVNEIMNFCDVNGNDVFRAQFGHDDFVMAQLQLEFAKDTGTVRNLIDMIGANAESTNDNFDIYNTNFNMNSQFNDMYSFGMTMPTSNDFYSSSGWDDFNPQDEYQQRLSRFTR